MTSHDLTWPTSIQRAFRGIDGCRGGWLIATVSDGSLDFVLTKDLSPFLYDSTTRTLIDMPIGLPSKQRRRCDLEGRGLLAHRRSTLFPVATRDALYASTYQECCEINATRQGCRVSKQLWNLVPKIREIDLLLRSKNELHDRIAEGHPELAFMSLQSLQTPLPSKRTSDGIEQRRKIINQHLPHDISMITAAFLRHHGRDVNITDCFDATALALMLARNNGGMTFIGDGLRDDSDLPMRIAASLPKNV